MRKYDTADFYARPVTAAFRESLSSLGIDPIQDDGFPLPAWNAEIRLDFMREAGIAYTRAVLNMIAKRKYDGLREKNLPGKRACAFE